MTKEENTREGRQRRVIGDEVQLPQTGTITRVREHTDPDDNWNYHLDVRIGPDRHPRKVPLAVPFPELAAPPRSESHPKGPDMALIQFLEDDDTSRPIATQILYNSEDRPPLGTEGIFRLRRGNLYVEMADDGSYARLSKKLDDTDTPDVVVEIDDTGTIKLGSPGGDMQPVARQGDTVEVSDPESGTLSGTITGGSSDVEST